MPVVDYNEWPGPDELSFMETLSSISAGIARAFLVPPSPDFNKAFHAFAEEVEQGITEMAHALHLF